MNKFIAIGWLKHSEEDNFEHGCIGKPLVYGGHDTFTGATVDIIIKQCADFAGQKDLSNCLLDSCEEAGRLDVQIYENANGEAIEIRDGARKYELWKAGKMRVWLSTYTFNILKTEKVILGRCVANKHQYAAA